MPEIKTRLKNYLTASLTINEVFLACTLLAINFIVSLIPYVLVSDLPDFEFFKALLGTVLFVGLFFIFPLYVSVKIIFFGSYTVAPSRFFELSIWATLWIMILIPINFITVFSNLANSLSISDYIIIIYLAILLLRMFLLFLLSAHFEIERFKVKHIPVNKVFLVVITAYSVFVLFQNPVLPSELQLDFFFNFFQSSALAFVSGSILLQLYYVIFSRKVNIN